MIDELDLLKKNWQNIDKTFTQVSENQIYNMIHKRSSNIVKWILIISFIELALFIFGAFYFKFQNEKKITLTENEYLIYNVIELIYLLILVFFIYKFYINYKKISFDSSSKKLLKNIVNTRKTVETYVKISIGYSITTTFIFIGIIFVNHGYVQKIIENFEEKGGIFLLYVIFIFTLLITIIIVYGLMWLFYKLLYGILLKKLLKNYKEIQQLEL
jgi:hypothetical protein